MSDTAGWQTGGSGPRKRLEGGRFNAFNAAKAPHHELSDEDRRPFDEKWPGAILEPVPTALYDCFEVGPKGMRNTGGDGAACRPWDPSHGFIWTAFSDLAGKTDLEVTPHIQSGHLPPPRMFDMRRLSCVFVPLLEWFEPDEENSDDYPTARSVRLAASYRDKGIDTPRLRADVAAIKATGHFSFRVGLKDYLAGPLALLPQPTGLIIPPQQQFWARVTFTVQPLIAFTWRVYLRAEGFLGLEVV